MPSVKVAPDPNSRKGVVRWKSTRDLTGSPKKKRNSILDNIEILNTLAQEHDEDRNINGEEVYLQTQTVDASFKSYSDSFANKLFGPKYLAFVLKLLRNPVAMLVVNLFWVVGVGIASLGVTFKNNWILPGLFVFCFIGYFGFFISLSSVTVARVSLRSFDVWFTAANVLGTHITLSMLCIHDDNNAGGALYAMATPCMVGVVCLLDGMPLKLRKGMKMFFALGYFFLAIIYQYFFFAALFNRLPEWEIDVLGLFIVSVRNRLMSFSFYSSIFFVKFTVMNYRVPGSLVNVKLMVKIENVNEV